VKGNLVNLTQEQKNAMEFEKLLCFARMKHRQLSKFDFNKYLDTVRPDIAQHIRDSMNSKRLKNE